MFSGTGMHSELIELLSAHFLIEHLPSECRQHAYLFPDLPAVPVVSVSCLYQKSQFCHLWLAYCAFRELFSSSLNLKVSTCPLLVQSLCVPILLLSSQLKSLVIISLLKAAGSRCRERVYVHPGLLLRLASLSLGPRLSFKRVILKVVLVV